MSDDQFDDNQNNENEEVDFPENVADENELLSQIDDDFEFEIDEDAIDFE